MVNVAYWPNNPTDVIVQIGSTFITPPKNIYAQETADPTNYSVIADEDSVDTLCTTASSAASVLVITARPQGGGANYTMVNDIFAGPRPVRRPH